MTETSKTTSKTRRGEGYASQGAVRQNGGTLPVYICNACQAEVVWATSKRTGRKYLANVLRGYHGQRYYVGADLHTAEKCERRQADAAEMVAEIQAEQERRTVAQAFTDRMKRAQQQLKAGEITEDQYLAVLDALDES